MSNKLPWFRLYANDFLGDRKIKRISKKTGISVAEIRGAWLGLLCLASDSPKRGSMLFDGNVPYEYEDLVDECGVEALKFHTMFAYFTKYNMIQATDEGVYFLPNWDKRQPISDNSKDRTRRYRQNRKNNGMSSAPKYNPHTIFSRDGHKCSYCGSTSNLCVDHIYPISLGGTDDERNLATACKKCNSGKAGRTPSSAGYKIINPTIAKRYTEYVTSCDGHSDLLEVEEESEEEEAAASPEYPPETMSGYQVQQFVVDVCGLAVTITVERQQNVKNAIINYGEEKTRDALSQSYSGWCETKSEKNGRKYSPYNTAWVDWGIEYLLTGQRRWVAGEVKSTRQQLIDAGFADG